MSKPARGTKRICKSCDGKFYDLNRKPIVCPLCGATHEADKPEPQKAAVVEEPVVDKQEIEEAPAEPAATLEAAATPEFPAEPAAAAGEPEIVSLEEAQAEEEGVALPEDDEDLVDLPDDDAEVPAAAEGEDDTFLEPEDEGEPDVEEIIGAPIKPDKEA